MSNRALVGRFHQWRKSGAPLVLATVIQTEGSTYSKAGRQILIRADGDYIGLVSGGCLEGDLAEHARNVIDTGTPVVVTYDMRTGADDLWGMGLGCNGMLKILLQRLSAADNWQPFTDLAAAMSAEQRSIAALVIAGTLANFPIGTHFVCMADGTWLGGKQPPGNPAVPAALPAIAVAATQQDQCELLWWTIYPWPRLLLLGAGPDTLPLLECAHTLGWEVTVADHRSHYIAALPAGLADHAHVIVAAELGRQLSPDRYSAVIVMSHHLETDRQYLQQLAHYQVPYVGLLGPAARKVRLLEELGLQNSEFGARLRGPVGLPIGADTPATIALAILSEIQSVLHTLR